MKSIRIKLKKFHAIGESGDGVSYGDIASILGCSLSYVKKIAVGEKPFPKWVALALPLGLNKDEMKWAKSSK